MDKTVKKPLQQRSQKRMELALNSAKTLLETMPLEQISIPEIAKHSGVPRSSIYQFFPNMTALLNELTQQNLMALLNALQENATQYLHMSMLEISRDLIQRTSDFYNQNHIASLLILNGVMSPETYQAQQSTIKLISKNVVDVLQHIDPPLYIPEDDTVIEHLIEITFSLMKHSYFKNGKITAEIQTDIIDLNRLYLQHKGYLSTTL